MSNWVVTMGGEFEDDDGEVQEAVILERCREFCERLRNDFGESVSAAMWNGTFTEFAQL